MMSGMNNDTIPTREHDAVTIARLERLAARRVATAPAGAGAEPLAPRGAPRRRAHPSKKSRIAALGLSLATTGGLTYTFAASASSAQATSSPAAGVVTAGAPTTAAAAAATGATVAANKAATAATSSAAAAVPATTAATATTAVNGAVYSNKYGAVQVQAVFAANGSLSAVNVIQLPTDRKSVGINNRAVPVLNSAALAAQSARVHSVSGATYTSTDYVKSLQSAIDTARASGITKLV
jgi:uncharacterized protein with FMN-binding domain